MKVRDIILGGLFTVSSCLGGNYTIQMGPGNYSGFTAGLNYPLFWDGDPTGSVIFLPTEENIFFINSRGNPFRATTRLGIQILNPDAFWSSSDLPFPILASSTFALATGAGGSIPIINQPLYPGIDLIKPNSLEPITPVGNAVETWLVDEYFLGNTLTAGFHISILTTFEFEPLTTTSQRIVIAHPGIVPAALSRGALVFSEFWIQDLNGNSVDYLSVIPEPSSLSFLLAGGAVFAAARRRKID